MSHLAVPAPVIPPSDEEKRAVELMLSRFGGSDAKAKRLKDDATRPETLESTPVPTFLERKNAAEQSSIQAEIDALL